MSTEIPQAGRTHVYELLQACIRGPLLPSLTSIMSSRSCQYAWQGVCPSPMRRPFSISAPASIVHVLSNRRQLTSVASSARVEDSDTRMDIQAVNTSIWRSWMACRGSNAGVTGQPDPRCAFQAVLHTQHWTAADTSAVTDEHWLTDEHWRCKQGSRNTHRC